MLDHLFHPMQEESTPLTASVNSGRAILLTGAGGYLGSALAKAIARSGPQLLILMDCAKRSLHRTQSELENTSCLPPVVVIAGNVCDGPLLAELFRKYRPDLIYHAAAAKSVPLLETDPIAAVWNNSCGTRTLARTAAQHSSATLIMISTDKAVNPRSVMGASKRIAELAVLRYSSDLCCMKAIRLGNVFGSTGSVVPLFREQILQGGPVTVTHDLISRYFFSLNSATQLIFSAASLEGPDSIFVPIPEDPIKILDLAKYMIRDSRVNTPQEIPITFTGLRPSDKLTEEFFSSSESPELTSDPRLTRVRTQSLDPSEFDSSMSVLEQSILRNDPVSLLGGVRRMVPEYEPSDTVLELSRVASV